MIKYIKKLLQPLRKIWMDRKRKLATLSLFRRYLSSNEAENLSALVSHTFEINITSKQIQEVAKWLRSTEKKMIGRIAGDIEDYILNYYMIYSASHIPSAKPIAHAEIGVLFGGSLLMMLHALRNSRSDHFALAIDPLDGYYGQNIDPASGLPVILENVISNVKHMGFGMEKVRIVKATSQSQEALDVAGSYSLATLWIDGDHSYEGVKCDWINYSPFVVSGGYILIDNYHDGVFTGIDKFVDEYLLPNISGWSVIAKINRSILFKKVNS